MPRNGSGGFAPLTNSWSPAVNGNSATTSDFNALLADIATSISQSVASDGQTPVTADLPMGGNKLTGLSLGVSSGDSLAWQQLFSQGVEVDVASASTCDIGAINSAFVRITGASTITSFGTTYRGPRFVRFGGALTLTHNATTLILPGGANITTAAGDCAIVRPVGAPGDGWVVIAYQPFAGYVALSGNQTIAGVKSFSAPPLLPGNAASALEPVPKQQLDTAVAAAVASALPPGVIMDYGGETAPAGWLECDGSSLTRASYPGLFAAIGTLHGSADSNSFNLPNHMGRFKRVRANGNISDPDRATRTAAAAGGVTGDRVGTLQDGQIQGHAHPFTAAVNGPGSFGLPGGGSFSISTGLTTSATGGNQTNPINAYVMSIIKT